MQDYLGALNFSGRSVLVVGGSSGIGNGIAQAFRHCGAAVQVWGTRPTAKDYDGVEGSDLSGLQYQCVNVADDAAVQNAALPERLDVLILSQGSVAYGRQEFEVATFKRILDINLTSLLSVAGKCRELLAAAHGSVITISSVGAFRATRGNPAYASSKAGAVMLTRVLAQGWAGEGIRVNGVAPGLVDTKLTKVTMNNPKRRAERIAGIPAGRLGEVEDMAGACLYLASPLASYVYGQTIVVDGGRML